MILVDASVLIDYFRSGDAKLLAHLQAFTGAICGITRGELLHGARDPKHRQSLIAALDALKQVTIPDQPGTPSATSRCLASGRSERAVRGCGDRYRGNRREC